MRHHHAVARTVSEPPENQQRVPGDIVLHPVALIAIAGLILNDQILKRWMGGSVPNKVSDFAGLVFFPLLLLAAGEVALRPLRTGRTMLLVAIVATGAVFTGIKLSPLAAGAYGDLLGWLRWPYVAVTHLARGHTAPAARRVHIVSDKGDLVALVALVVPWWVAKQRVDQPVQPCR